MAKEATKKAGSILGDIAPKKSDQDHVPVSGDESGTLPADDEIKSMEGDSEPGRSRHSGSRDVTDGGGTGTEVGGTRNYRQGTGARGGDIGNRPE